MASQKQGRQSPAPEDQTDFQRSSSASGHTMMDKNDTKYTAESQLENLESNPKPVLDDHLKESTKKDMPQKKD